MVLWELSLFTLLVTALYFLGVWTRSDFVQEMPTLVTVLIALLAVCRIVVWWVVTGGPYRVPVRAVALAAAAAMIGGLLSPWHYETAEQLHVCALFSATPGGGTLWSDAGEPTGKTNPDHLVGHAQWTSHEEELMVGGHGDTVTSLRFPGRTFAARSAEDGEVLWHVDTARTRHLPDLQGFWGPDPSRIHQVGDTVLVGYPSSDEYSLGEHLVGYDAATGVMEWCVPDLKEVVADPHEPTRFLARNGSHGSGWGLYDTADASLVASLDSGLHHRAILADGRATVWDSVGFTSYESDSGDRLAQDGPEDREVVSAMHVDDITVLSFAPEGDEEERESHAVAAYDAVGNELWDSEGTGPLQEGEALVGTGFDDCSEEPLHGRGVFKPGFDGHFTTSDIPSTGTQVAVVRASDGTVSWIAGDEARSHRDRLNFNSCIMYRHSLDDRLHFGSGTVLDAEGIVTQPETPAGVSPTAYAVHTANGSAIRKGEENRFTFHSLP